MKLMVLIDGYGKPYKIGDIFKKRRVEPLHPTQKTNALKPSPNTTASSSTNKTQKALDRYNEIQNFEPKQRAPLFLAKDIMSSPVTTCEPRQTLTEIWNLLREKRFRHLPVSPDGKKIIGIISDRDILKYAPYVANKNAKVQSHTSVESVMSKTILSARHDSEIREIAKAFFEERVGCMPIITDNDELMGIVTRSDILRTLMNHAPLELWG